MKLKFMNIKLRKTLVAFKMNESQKNNKTVVKRFIGDITTYFVAGSSF